LPNYRFWAVVSKGTLSMKKASTKKRFCIDFEQSDWDNIVKRAKMAKLKPTAFIRRSALTNEINVYEPKDINHLIREIHSIGVNINQIVHLCNTVHRVSQDDIDFLKMKMHHIDVSIAVNSKPWEKRQCRT
jgi:hypothetical protein